MKITQTKAPTQAKDNHATPTDRALAEAREHFNSKPMGAAELETLRAEYPEGIPPWIVERSMSLNEARDMMALRREAFPATAS